MEARGQGEKRRAEEAVAGGEEAVLSLVDVLEQDEALEDEACAVLGGSDAEKCSYPEEKENFNAVNKYNANFFGLYCTCKRPYPDPEDETPDEMIQCVVCEDWFHGRHLGAVPPEHLEYQEMVCQVCMKRCPFLWAYAAQLAVPTVTKITPAESDHEDIKVEDTAVESITVQNGSNGKTEENTIQQYTKHQQVQEEKDKHNGPSTSAETAQKCTNGDISNAVVTEANPGTACKLQENKRHEGHRTDTATFWPSNWRSKLCNCGDCMKMYADLEVVFLVDERDTVQAYENKGKNDEDRERKDPLMAALSSMNRVQQVELISEYNDLKTELKDYLKRFADEGKVVKTEDIQQFFEELQSRKRRRVAGMQYYCS
ncbi:putative E3 ubiquitin-protein ligase UBR7 isoform X2 [Ascaphus truei]|uniref:putative E3 ubiquitin-protein ligase UBR7 isoform X2 n=1 Tax=Ascaphus truei TaxID=8439 RepID=UPI003F595C86